MKHLELPGTCRLVMLLPLWLTMDVSLAQSKNPSLTWDHPITVRPATMQFNDSVLQAFSFPIYEADVNSAMAIWTEDHSSKCTSIAKRQPVLATDCHTIHSGNTLEVVARAEEQKRPDRVEMTIAFMDQQGGEVPAMEQQQQIVEQMALAYNRKVVEAQIKAQEEVIAQTGKKLDKSMASEEKLQDDIAKNQKELNKIKMERAKQQEKNTRVQQELLAAERAYAQTNDVKDLKRVNKARTKLADGEARTVKLMEKETKLSTSAGKLEKGVPKTMDKKHEYHQDHLEEQRKLDALRMKLTNVR